MGFGFGPPAYGPPAGKKGPAKPYHPGYKKGHGFGFRAAPMHRPMYGPGYGYNPWYGAVEKKNKK